jgi:hypothetical protein
VKFHFIPNSFFVKNYEHLSFIIYYFYKVLEKASISILLPIKNSDLILFLEYISIYIKS